MMRLRSDLVALCQAALDGKLDSADIEWDNRAALGVVLTAEGYPGAYDKGAIIHGLPTLDSEDQKVFHAGTALDAEGNVITSGGRVLCAVGLGDSVSAAQERAYHLAGRISWKGVYHRRDIGYRAVERERQTGQQDE